MADGSVLTGSSSINHGSKGSWNGLASEKDSWLAEPLVSKEAALFGPPHPFITAAS